MPKPNFNVVYSTEDGEYVATSPEYPGLSYLDPIPYVAVSQLMYLILEADDMAGSLHEYKDERRKNRSHR